MRLNDRFSARRQRADHQRLGQARHAFQQAVPAAEQRDQQLLDHLVLADDHLGELLEIFSRACAQLADGGRVVERLAESVMRGFPEESIGGRAKRSRGSEPQALHRQVVLGDAAGDRRLAQR